MFCVLEKSALSNSWKVLEEEKEKSAHVKTSKDTRRSHNVVKRKCSKRFVEFAGFFLIDNDFDSSKRLIHKYFWSDWKRFLLFTNTQTLIYKYSDLIDNDIDKCSETQIQKHKNAQRLGFCHLASSLPRWRTHLLRFSSAMMRVSTLLRLFRPFSQELNFKIVHNLIVNYRFVMNFKTNICIKLGDF